MNQKELKKQADLLLKKSGFKDIELERLQQKKNGRNFQNREAILDFFLELDSYLTHHGTSLPKRTFLVLSLWSEGVSIAGTHGIAKQAKCSTRTVDRILKEYRMSRFALLCSDSSEA